MSSSLRDLLQRIVPLLESAQVPFMIAGSFASATHGQPRTTQDLDVVIDPLDPKALETLLSSLTPDRYYVDPDAARDAFVRRSMFNVVDQTTGWKADFILHKNRPFSRQRRDVAGVVAAVGDALDRAYVERWVNALDLADEWAAARKA